MKRNKHSLSHYKLATFNMGQLVPVGCFEVLPGDTIQQASSALLRASPLNAPVMHPISVRIHHWFVPYRLVWTSWQNFITGGADGLDASAFPTIDLGAAGRSAKGLLGDYFGLPVGLGASEPVSALPFRAYCVIWNEFYRDQDLQSPAAVSFADGVDATTYSNVPLNCAWEKDYFTSARPWTQKGAAVTLPLGTTAPVIPDGTIAPTFRSVADATSRTIQSVSPNKVIQSSVNQADSSDLHWLTSGLKTDLSGATAVDVNTVRRAFAIQRYEEARALYGSRYTEYLRYLGVRSSDARLQRPEYLGGGKQTISFSEVLQTAEGTNAVGTLRGHGLSALRSRRYRKFFEEHGVVISLMSVRPRAMYVGGTLRMWNRRVKEDFWQKELESIGQQSVFRNEVWTDPAAPGTNPVFGYADRYSEYRHEPSQVTGSFRDTLNFWHEARIFAAAPALNAAFVSCVPSTRIHAVTTEHTMWVMVNHSIQARRMVGKRGVGRVI